MPNVRGKTGGTPWTLVSVPRQVVDHTAHVPRLLRVQDSQHRLRGPHQCEPLHRHQRQRGHLRAGALHRQCKCCRESSCAGLSISRSRGQGLIVIPLHASVVSHHPPLCPVSGSLFPGFLFLIVLSSHLSVSFNKFFYTFFCLHVAFPIFVSPSIFAFHFRCRLWLAPFLPEALISSSLGAVCCSLSILSL